jgi:polygalacturonase
VEIDPGQGGDVSNIEIRNSTLAAPVADVSAVGQGTFSNIWIHDNQLDGGQTKVYVNEQAPGSAAKWRIYRNRGDVSQTLGSYVSFTNVSDVLMAYNLLPATVVPLRAAVQFANAQADLALLTNDFTGACHPYYEDARSAPVKSQGNKVSNC